MFPDTRGSVVKLQRAFSALADLLEDYYALIPEEAREKHTRLVRKLREEAASEGSDVA